ncbi:MAG TPA: hypothetical protein PLC54_09405, partial [Spirochaetales bacterium]|nr:hypothetical protein [Spirochaetales bacterium]
LSISTAQSEELAGSSPKDASGESSWYRYTESGSTMLAYSRFNGDGRLSTRHVYRLPEGSDQSITLLVEERYAYEDGRLTSMTVLTDAARSERSVQYDTQGRAYREEYKQGGKILSTVERNWDDKGLLLVERSQSKQGIATLTYEYAPDARLVAQRWLQNGIPVRTLLYEAEGITVEELFDNGNLFAKIWKKDGVKVREQIIRNGEVLRERLFP